MRCFSPVCFAFLVLATIAPSQAGDWPTFGQNIYRNAVTKESLDAPKLGVAWAWQSHFPPQPAWYGPAKWDAYAGIRGLRSMRNYDPVFHPIVVGQKLFFGSSADDCVHCLDLQTGKIIWTFHTEGPVRVAPSFFANRVYFGSDDGHAYCVSADTGQQVWRFRPPRSTPDQRIVNNGRLISMWPCRTGVAVLEGTAYCAFSLLPWRESYLCALDATTGTPTGKGRFLKTLRHHTMEGPLVLSPERIIVPQGRVEPHLFQRTTGKSLGKLRGGGGSFVVLTPDSLILHGPGNKTGWIKATKAGKKETVATYRNGNAIVVAGTHSYLLTDQQLVASNWFTRKVLWKVPCRYPYGMIVTAKSVFVGGQNEVAAFDRKSGRQAWKHTVQGKAYGLVAANGLLIVSTDQGHIYGFRPGAPQKIAPTPKTTKQPSLPLTKIKPVATRGLVGRWVFQSPHVAGSNAQDLAGKQRATLSGRLRFERVGGYEALRFGNIRCVLSENHQTAKLPETHISAAAWVRIDRAKTWGSIIGAIQDNGAYERGWLLGNRGQKFCFAVAAANGKGKPRLTYMTAPRNFEVGRWYHVAGSYDGREMKLAVNGKVVATSNSQRGKIAYPPQAFYEIGAYHDKDENFPLDGLLHEVQVFNRALTAADFRQLARAKAFRRTDPYELAAGPSLKFTSPTSAVVEWASRENVPSSLALSLDGKVIQQIQTKKLSQKHRVQLTKLQPGRYYTYQIQRRRNGKQVSTEPFECDLFFNYQTPRPPASIRRPGKRYDFLYSQVKKQARHGRGLCLILGRDDGELATSLAELTQMRVVVVTLDRAHTQRLRQRIAQHKLVAARVAVVQVRSLDSLPFTRGVFNFVISASSAGQLNGSASELTRVLAPHGRLLIGEPGPTPKVTTTQLRGWLAKLKNGTVKKSLDGVWGSYHKPLPEGAGSWSHLYGTPANTAFGGEALAGASSTKELAVQWIGRPGSRYQADRNGRKPSPLSINGRLYLQGLRRLIAMDAYNGTILWSRELPRLKRFNMPRDCGNWCADQEDVFVAIDHQCLRLSGDTGDVKHRYSVNGTGRWGFVARAKGRLLGSSVRHGAHYTSFWGGANEGWYDAKSGPATFKVCSDRLFSIDVNSHSRVWSYQGLIVNSTISLDENNVYFVECRDEKLLQGKARRLGSKAFWKSLYLVSLDQRTGKKHWEKPLQIAAGTVVFFLAVSDGHLSLVSSSSDRKYHVHVYSTAQGKQKWATAFPWPSDNHGGHMSRPAIVGKTLYVRPRAFELKTGLLLSRRMPHGSCGTYACTRDAMFFRAGNVTVWDRQRGSTTKWSRLRPDCWLSTIPAGGMLLSPEGGGGCSCGSWMETSIGFAPRKR